MRRRRHITFTCLLLMSLFGGWSAAVARAADCLTPIAAAERHFHLPEGLLAAIALTESGQGGVPQPWALNIAGQAISAPSYQAAAALLRDARGTPRRDVAIGCMQIHMSYHLDRIGEPELALDPVVNVWYGAAYLDELYRRYGNWISAIGHYHASDAEAQSSYRCGVARRLLKTAPDNGRADYFALCGAAEPYRRLAIGRDRPHWSARLMESRRIGKIIVLGADR
jgi:soluble lytic murein transglycosylase-like protein